jgi:hypothetical protein
MVDCTGSEGERKGCEGGDPSAGCGVIEQLGGIELEKDYPYVTWAKDASEKCTFSRRKTVVTVTDHSHVGSRYLRHGIPIWHSPNCIYMYMKISGGGEVNLI